MIQNIFLINMVGSIFTEYAYIYALKNDEIIAKICTNIFKIFTNVYKKIGVYLKHIKN